MKWKTASGEILDIKDMGTQHLKNCRAQLMRRIIDPYDVVGDKFGGSFTESCILEENKILGEKIKEITLEINSR